MSGANRRRLRRLSREYVRPGVHVPDMHEALVRIQQQRTEWQRYVDPGVTPEVPLGLADVHVAWQRVEADLGELDAHPRSHRRRPARDAAGRAARAHARRRSPPSPTSSTTSSSARRCAPSSPRSASSRCSPSSRCGTCREDRVAAELEFAWWQSALEHLLRSDRALLGANTAVVDRLERDFRLVDEAHAAASGPLLAAQLATQWRIGIVDEPDEAAALKRALKRGAVTPAEVADGRADAARARWRRCGWRRRTTCPTSPTRPPSTS